MSTHKLWIMPFVQGITAFGFGVLMFFLMTGKRKIDQIDEKILIE